MQKIAKATSDLIGNKIADKTTRVSRGSPQKQQKMKQKTQELIEKLLRQQVINDLRLM